MYEEFYGFHANPFQLTPDSRFFFGSREHRKAVSFLEYGISQREGFVVITGEIGAGKTTLVEQMLARIDRQQYTVAKVATTQLGSFDVLCMISAGFGVFREGASKSTLIMQLMEYFRHAREDGKYPLVIVDEAQSLTTEALEEVRMLSNLAVGTSAPFQGILLGQPEFRDALSLPGLQQFRQRVIASCHLEGLSESDTRAYVEYRLARVGWRKDPSFSAEAFKKIYTATRGIPRRINTLCSRLLLLGYLEERHSVEGRDVDSVASEMRDELGPKPEVIVDPQTVTTEVDPNAAGSDTRDASPMKGNLANAEMRPAGQIIPDPELRLRVERLEQTAERHRATITRALRLALGRFPAAESE